VSCGGSEPDDEADRCVTSVDVQTCSITISPP